MKNRIILIALLLSLTVNVFAIKSYAGTESSEYATSSQAKPAIELEFELGTVFGYDLDLNQAGFREIIDLDLTFVLNPFTVYSSDLKGIDLDKAYGVVDVAGADLQFNVSDAAGAGDKTDNTDPAISINYELIYGKIVLDPFYLLVAASEVGNHYARNNGWNFSRATSSVRADIAHIGYNVPWAGVNNTQLWTTTGASNQLDNASADSLLGLGYVVGATEVMFQVGSVGDWETNTENEFDFGFMLESNPVGNLTVQSQAFTGINYEIQPINFAVGAGYFFELTDIITFTPSIGFDGEFIGTEDSPTDEFESETSICLSFGWPGSVGWGYEPLNDAEVDRFSGLTVGTDIYNQPDQDPRIAISITSYEETNGGLIPNLGTSLVLEFNDITNYKDADRDYIKTGFGIYVDYNVMDICKPFIRSSKTSGLDDAAISFESGVEFTSIPNTVITVGYDSADINDWSNNKGLVYTEFKVVL